MRLLAIETSCDETAVAILHDGAVVADLIASQDELHAPYGGIVPELASRRQMEMLPGMVEAALHLQGLASPPPPAKPVEPPPHARGARWEIHRSALTFEAIDGIAVTRAPGLIGSLLVGVSFAKALAFAHRKPLVGVNHLEGHLHAARLEHPEMAYPYLGLVVSGGHTSLYLVRDFGQYTLLGATRDDAAGEAFDKVAKLLGLGFPGGPAVSRLAEQGDPKAVRFTPPKIGTGSAFAVGPYDFSFSGIKAAVARYLEKHGSSFVVRSSSFAGEQRTTNDERRLADLAASFQHAVVEQLCRRLQQAAKDYQCPRIVVSGGVAANRALRERLQQMTAASGYQLAIPALRYCTDNAVMIGIVGAAYLARGIHHDLTMNAAAVEELGAPVAHCNPVT